MKLYKQTHGTLKREFTNNFQDIYSLHIFPLFQWNEMCYYVFEDQEEKKSLFTPICVEILLWIDVRPSPDAEAVPSLQSDGSNNRLRGQHLDALMPAKGFISLKFKAIDQY